MEAVMRIKGEHYLKRRHPVLIHQVYWHNKISCCRCNPMFSWWCLLSMQGNAFRTQLSPGLASFLLVSAVIWIALHLSPSRKDQEGVLGGNPEQSICLIIPSLFTEGEKLTCQMPLRCRKENADSKRNIVREYLGKGAFCTGKSPDMPWYEILTIFGLQLFCNWVAVVFLWCKKTF